MKMFDIYIEGVCLVICYTCFCINLRQLFPPSDIFSMAHKLSLVFKALPMNTLTPNGHVSVMPPRFPNANFVKFFYELLGITVHWKLIQRSQPWGGLTTEFLSVCRNASVCILFTFLYKSSSY